LPDGPLEHPESLVDLAGNFTGSIFSAPALHPSVQWDELSLFDL